MKNPSEIYLNAVRERLPHGFLIPTKENNMDYHSTAWKKRRAAVLHRDEYRCVECRRFGKLKTATTAHHVFPVEYFPQYQWEGWNLASLCSACHDRMHDRETHQLTAAGWNLLERTARKNGKEVTSELRRLLVAK